MSYVNYIFILKLIKQERHLLQGYMSFGQILKTENVTTDLIFLCLFMVFTSFSFCTCLILNFPYKLILGGISPSMYFLSSSSTRNSCLQYSFSSKTHCLVHLSHGSAPVRDSLIRTVSLYRVNMTVTETGNSSVNSPLEDAHLCSC